MTQIKPINLSPSFLAKVYDKGYDYAVGEKLGLIKKDSVAMSDGRLIHALIAERLGGENTKIAISPFDNFRTKEARNWRDSQPDDTAIVTEDKVEHFNKIVDRLLAHPIMKLYLGGELQPELLVEKKVNEFNVKGVIDLVAKLEKTITVFDWKFINTKSFDKFTKEALWSHYDLQSAVYDFLAEPTSVMYVAIENEAPHRIKVFNCDPSFLEAGADKFDKALKVVKKANWREPNFDIPELGELKDWGSM